MVNVSQAPLILITGEVVEWGQPPRGWPPQEDMTWRSATLPTSPQRWPWLRM